MNPDVDWITSRRLSRPTSSNIWVRSRSDPNNSSICVIPGYLLAGLAVAESSQGTGNGGRLLVETLRTTLEAIRVGGGRVIVVDAIDDHAHNFHQHFGFKPIPDTGAAS